MTTPDKPSRIESPEEMIFDANLQEFASKIGFICALENNDKITAAEAYERIKKLWKELKASKKGLQIGADQPKPPQQ